MKWKAPVIYTAAGVLIGSTLMTATPAFASLNFRPFQANLVQNGQVVSKPSAIAYNGTSYFGIWWLQQQLKKDGISVQWDGKSLTLTGMPVQSTDTLSAQGSNSNGSTVIANTINVNGVTYVPLSEVQSLLQSAGSQVQLKSGHEDQGDAQGNNLQGVINQLKDVSEKLSEYQSGVVHGDGGSAGEAFSSFAGSLMQLQNVINQLSQLSQSTATSTSGTTSTTTGTGSTDSSTGSTGSGTQGSTGSSTGSSTQQTATQPVQLSGVVTSLQNDWNALNTYALQTIAGTSGTATNSTSGITSTSTSSQTSSSTDLSSVISDINTQIKALSSISVHGDSGTKTSEQGDH